MRSNLKDEISLILDYFEKFQKYQIQVCVYRHPDFNDYLIDPSADRHFKHLWNEIVKIVKGEHSFPENMSSLHDFTLFTQKYTKSYISYFFHPERIEKICQTCIKNNKFSEILFNIFIQVIIPQKPRKSLEMVQSVLNIYENSNADSTALRQLNKFYQNLLNIENDSEARKLIYSLDQYLIFRERSLFVSKLSSKQFSHILIMIFQNLKSFPSSLFHILQYDPFIFSYLKCDEISNINISQIPPFSSILQSKEEVPKSFFMRYREIFLNVINMLLLFSKSYFTTEERGVLTQITSNVLSYVESGSVGRDAFVFILLYFLRSDFLRKNAEIFLKYISEGETKMVSDNNSEAKRTNSFINIPRFNCISILVFSFDSDIFPSTISLICNDNCVTLITNTLVNICNHFPDSPFKDKARSVFAKISGHPSLKKSICERATQITYQIWKNGLTDSNKNEATKLLIDLSQRRSNMLYKEGPTIYVDPRNMKYFLQLALAFFTKNKSTRFQFPFYSYIACILLSLTSTNSPRKPDDIFFSKKNKNNEEENNIINDNSRYPFHFYFNVSSSDQNYNNIFAQLPRWHIFSIQKESILTNMVDGIDLMPFLVRTNESFTPSLFIGSILIFSKFLQRDDPICRQDFTRFSSIHFTFLPIFLQKATLYELPEVTRELMRFMERCPDMSIECIQFLTNALITTGKTNGFRTFIRFLAPLFRNEQYVKQISIRGYYVQIVHKLLEFTDINDEIVTSLSFIYFWRVLGTFPDIKNNEATLQKLIGMTMPKITNNENEDIFYLSLFELIITHGAQFLIELLANVDDSTLFNSSKLAEMLLKLPKKLVNEIISKKEKVPAQILDILNSYEPNDDNTNVHIKWVPWPIDEFIYDVTGYACKCDL